MFPYGMDYTIISVNGFNRTYRESAVLAVFPIPMDQSVTVCTKQITLCSFFTDTGFAIFVQSGIINIE